MSRRVMHEFDLHFVSGVTRPAQKPARATYIKREEPSTMKTAEQLAKMLATVATFSAEEFAFYKGLSASDQESFLEGTGADRASQVAKAESANPVVYESKRTGNKYRKSDGVAAQLAKDLDDSIVKSEARESVAKMERLTAIAKSEYAHLGDAKFVTVLLEKIDDLPAETKEGCTAILKAQVEKFEAAGRSIGTERGKERAAKSDPSGQDAAQKIDAAVEKYAVDRKISKAQAYPEFMNSDEGQKLMKQYDEERGAAS